MPCHERKTRELAITERKKLRINEKIRVPQVRLIDTEGNQVGVIPTEEALKQAQGSGLDLVEVAPNAEPPVCRLLDYGKYAYRVAKEQKQRPHNTQLKEVKFRPKIDDHDFDFKVGHIERFLQQGHMVKATVMFRGREVVHPEYGHRILERVMSVLGDGFRLDKPPSMQGRLMIMILAPKRS
ncbi:MAG: translation initiation factor IF-3 [Acidobacteriota bacterium]